MSADPALSDGALARAALDGDQQAFAMLVRRHRDPVYRYIHAHVGDADEALDLTQESFIAVYRALDRYDPDRPFRAWIARIALNKCRDWANRRRVRRFFSFARPLDEAFDLRDDAVSADTALADRQELARVQRCIAGLPASLREPLLLHTVEGLSQAETAQVLAISEKAVEIRIYRARRRLSEMLESQ